MAADDVSKINVEIDALKKTLEGSDSEAIKAQSQKLTDVSYEVFGKIYQQQGAQQGAAGPEQGGPQDGGPANDGGTVNADYDVK